MRIGIDAKWFFNGPPSGIVVVRNLVQHLIEQNRRHHIHLFLDKREKNRKFPFSSDRVHLHYVWAGNNQLSNLFLLPFYARNLQLDCVLFMTFAPLCRGFTKISLVLDVIFASNPEFFTFLERVYFYPVKFLSRRADRLCTISESEKKRMISFGYADASMIDVLPLGVSKEFKPKESLPVETIAHVRSKYGLPDRFILYVGRLNIRKNLLNLLRAIAIQKDPTIPLVIAGEHDWKMPSMQVIVDELNLQKRLIFTGKVDGAHLKTFFSLATVFAFPSYEEGFGLPPLEAMASGVPVVVSDRSSLPEVCSDAGTYCDPDDPASIAAGLDLLLEDGEYFNAMRNKGLIRAAEYTWERSARTLLDIMEGTANCISCPVRLTE